MRTLATGADDRGGGRRRDTWCEGERPRDEDGGLGSGAVRSISSSGDGGRKASSAKKSGSGVPGTDEDDGSRSTAEKRS